MESLTSSEANLDQASLHSVVDLQSINSCYLQSPLDCKEIKESILKGISPEYSLERLMLKLKHQYFGHLMGRTDSLEKTLMLGKIEGRKRSGWHH